MMVGPPEPDTGIAIHRHNMKFYSLKNRYTGLNGDMLTICVINLFLSINIFIFRTCF